MSVSASTRKGQHGKIALMIARETHETGGWATSSTWTSAVHVYLALSSYIYTVIQPVLQNACSATSSIHVQQAQNATALGTIFGTSGQGQGDSNVHSSVYLFTNEAKTERVLGTCKFPKF